MYAHDCVYAFINQLNVCFVYTLIWCLLDHSIDVCLQSCNHMGMHCVRYDELCICSNGWLHACTHVSIWACLCVVVYIRACMRLFMVKVYRTIDSDMYVLIVCLLGMFVLIHVFVNARLHAWLFVLWDNVYTHVCACGWIWVGMCLWMHLSMHGCMHTYACAHACVHVWMCVCACTHSWLFFGIWFVWCYVWMSVQIIINAESTLVYV